MAYADLSALPLTGSIVWKNHMVTVGGEGTSDSALIRKAFINADGSLDAWSTIGQLPIAKVGVTLAINPQGLLYIVGGVESGAADADGSAVSQGQKIYKIQLDENANVISPLVALGSVPVSLVNPTVTISGEYIYVSGGQSIVTSLSYDGQPVALDTGSSGNLVGVTSGESAPIYAVDDSGATGNFDVQVLDPSNPPSYTNNEVIYDDVSLWGRALANGATSAIKLEFDGQVTNFVDTSSIGVFSDETDYSTLDMTAVITSHTDAGATGVLTLQSVVGDDTSLDGSKICVRQGVAVANGANFKKLNFDGQTSNFSVSDVVSVFTTVTDYSTIEMTGTVTAQTDAGATGTLSFASITGGTPPIDGLSLCVRQGVAVANGVVYKELAYDNQTGNFTVGQTITGGTSGATAVIYADTDSGTTGVLKLTNIVGIFQDNEVITDPITGSADVAGTISASKIDYDGQTQNFTTTARLFGVTSGATAIIDADTDGGTTGVLTLSSVSGTFQDNEALVAYTATKLADVDGEVYDALDYDGQTQNFTTTARLFGVTSGATAIIDADTDGGTTGVLSLSSLSGTFQNNEAIVAYSAAAYADALGEMYVSVAYDGRTGHFAVGETVTGIDSGATLVITELTAQVGSTGTLRGIVASGDFTNNENIYSNVLGSAKADGVLVLESSPSNISYRARIMSDGSIGAWTTIGDIS